MTENIDVYVAFVIAMALLYALELIANWFKVRNFIRDSKCKNPPRYAHGVNGKILEPCYHTPDGYYVFWCFDDKNLIAYKKKEFINNIVRIHDYA